MIYIVVLFFDLYSYYESPVSLVMNVWEEGWVFQNLIYKSLFNKSNYIYF